MHLTFTPPTSVWTLLGSLTWIHILVLFATTYEPLLYGMNSVLHIITVPFLLAVTRKFLKKSFEKGLVKPEKDICLLLHHQSRHCLDAQLGYISLFHMLLLGHSRNNLFYIALTMAFILLYTAYSLLVVTEKIGQNLEKLDRYIRSQHSLPRWERHCT